MFTTRYYGGLLLLCLASYLPAQELIFHTGFEPGLRIISQGSSTAQLAGADQTLDGPIDWVEDLIGSPYVGNAEIQYQDRDDEQQAKRRAEIVMDPTGSGRGQVLKYWILDDHVTFDRGRIQANFYGGEEGLREYYHRFKMYLPSESFRPLLDHPDTYGFLTIIEIWNDNNWDPAFGTPDAYPYRVSVNVSKPYAGDPNVYLRATGEQQSRSCCWGEGEDKQWETVSGYALPLDTWLDVEFYLREGDAETGRVQLAVTPAGGTKQLALDITGFTRHPDDPAPDGVKYSNPLKMYTNGSSTLDKVREAGDTLKIYWDDLEFWNEQQIDLSAADTVPPSCGPDVDWVNTAFTPREGNIEASWRAIPEANNMDGLVGLSAGPATAYGDLACIVRFNPDGYIDARDGGSFTAAAAIPYTAGATYTVRLEINQTDRTYSAFVSPGGGQEQTIGTDLAFRSEQSEVGLLDNYTINTERCGLTVEGFIGGADTLSCEQTITWANTDFAPREGLFSASWRAIPEADSMNGVVGLSAGPAAAYGDLACIVRFNPNGYIDARSGGEYVADSAISYAGGTSYSLRLEVNQTEHTYSAFVTPAGGEELTIGTDLAYRSEQSEVDLLNSYAINTERCVVAVQGFVISGPEDPTSTGRSPDIPLAFAVYPNPSRGQLRMESDQDYRFSLYDVSGRLVLQGRRAAGTTELNVSGLPPGAYHLRIRTGRLQALHHRLLIQ